MTMLDRRSLLAGASLPLFAIRSRPARAAEFSLKLANNSPVTHPQSVRQSQAADRIRQATNEQVDIQVFPNNQLGSDTDMLSQLRSGALDYFTLSGLILSTLVPAASINGIGFAFKDYDTVWQAMDGKLGAYVRGEIDKRGLIAMEKIWDNGFRQITSSTHPIKAPADLRGFKIRVPVSPLWTSMFQALGASPISINFAEVYSALQTKIAEGQENPLSLIQIAKLYEVQKYVLDDQPHVGWLLDVGQQAKFYRPAARGAGHRGAGAEPLGPGGTSRYRGAEQLGGGRSEVQGTEFRRGRQAGVPRRAKAGRLLRRVEEAIRRRALGDPGVPGRLPCPDMAHDLTAIRSPPGLLAARIDGMLRLLAEVPAALLVLAEIGVLFTGVVARYVFHAPLVWTDELASILFLWLAMLGAVIALQRSEHMRLTALVSAMSPAGRARSRGPGGGGDCRVPADGRAVSMGLRVGPVVHRDAGAGQSRHLVRAGRSWSAAC